MSDGEMWSRLMRSFGFSDPTQHDNREGRRSAQPISHGFFRHLGRTQRHVLALPPRGRKHIQAIRDPGPFQKGSSCLPGRTHRGRAPTWPACSVC
jgi:hypothetical protein